jgi:ATP-dependent Clp protease ATP-binding subunit ClpC
MPSLNPETGRNRMFQRFNETARRAIDKAARKAKDLHQPVVGPEHILASLADGEEFEGSSFHSLLTTFALDEKQVSEAVGALPDGGAPPSSKGDPAFSEEAKRVLEFAVEEADKLGHKRIGTSHFLLGLIRDELEGDGGGQILTSLGLTLDDVRGRVRELADDEAAGKQDVVPAILFFELDRRAREAEKTLTKRVDDLESETRSLRSLLELAAERISRLEADGRPPSAAPPSTGKHKR